MNERVWMATDLEVTVACPACGELWTVNAETVRSLLLGQHLQTMCQRTEGLMHDG